MLSFCLCSHCRSVVHLPVLLRVFVAAYESLFCCSFRVMYHVMRHVTRLLPSFLPVRYMSSVHVLNACHAFVVITALVFSGGVWLASLSSLSSFISILQLSNYFFRMCQETQRITPVSVLVMKVWIQVQPVILLTGKIWLPWFNPQQHKKGRLGNYIGILGNVTLCLEICPWIEWVCLLFSWDTAQTCKISCVCVRNVFAGAVLLQQRQWNGGKF